TSGELESDFEVSTERLRKLRSALTDVQIGIAGGPMALSSLGGSGRDAAASADDEILKAYADEQARLELQLTESLSHGLTQSHPAIIRLQAAVQACAAQMKLLVEGRNHLAETA